MTTGGDIQRPPVGTPTWPLTPRRPAPHAARRPGTAPAHPAAAGSTACPTAAAPTSNETTPRPEPWPATFASTSIPAPRLQGQTGPGEVRTHITRFKDAH